MKDMRRALLPLVTCSTMLAASIGGGQPARAQSPNPHAVSMYNLGLNAYKQGSPESAIIFFKRATDIDPNLADAQYNLGVLYQSQRRYKESASRFAEVLRIKPNDCDALFQLGVVTMGLGQYGEAKKYFASIPPANAHFQEAQRKSSECDGKAASGAGSPVVNADPVQISAPPQSSGSYAPSTPTYGGTSYVPSTPSFNANPGAAAVVQPANDASTSFSTSANP